jgi:hypothetical protein
LDIMQNRALAVDWLFLPGKWWAELLADLTKHLMERRQAPRRRVVRLAANYLDGTACARHVVRDISIAGAFIFADFKWMAGTIVTMTLERTGSYNSPPVVLRAKVVRCTQDGLGVQFVFLSKGERHRVVEFLKSVPEAERGR